MAMNAGDWIWMAVWIVALLAMGWLLLSGRRGARHDTPAEILRSRFAAGQISEDEFRHARDVLGTGEQHT